MPSNEKRWRYDLKTCAAAYTYLSKTTGTTGTKVIALWEDISTLKFVSACTHMIFCNSEQSGETNFSTIFGTQRWMKENTQLEMTFMQIL